MYLTTLAALSTCCSSCGSSCCSSLCCSSCCSSSSSPACRSRSTWPWEVMLMAGVCDGATVLRIYLDVLWRGLAWGCARRTACRPSYGAVGTASACILLHAETGGRTPRLTDSSRVTPVGEILIAPGPRRNPPRKSSYQFWNKSLMKVSHEAVPGHHPAGAAVLRSRDGCHATCTFTRSEGEGTVLALRNHAA